MGTPKTCNGDLNILKKELLSETIIAAEILLVNRPLTICNLCLNIDEPNYVNDVNNVSHESFGIKLYDEMIIEKAEVVG